MLQEKRWQFTSHDIRDYVSIKGNKEAPYAADSPEANIVPIRKILRTKL